MKNTTTSVHGDISKRRPHANHVLITPIAQSATYMFDDTADLVNYMESKLWGSSDAAAGRAEYGRYGNPTVRAVEKRIAALENAGDAIMFPSGMAAITNTLLTILAAGTHVIYTDDCYRKTRTFCKTFLSRYGVESTEVPMGDFDALEAAIRPETRVIISESPTNPYMRVVDLEKLVAIAKKHNRIKTIIDSTFATPINQNPLDFGIDIVLHSATKYMAGHNDVLAGVIVGSANLLHPLRLSQGMLGGVLDPHAAYLVERGLKTMALRIAQQNRSAQAIAEFLEQHPKIERVWYPGLESHPDHAVASAQMRGYGGVVSFEIAAASDQDALATGAKLIDAMKIPYIAASLGGAESLIEQPSIMSYYELSTEERLAIGISDSLIRFAIGIEGTEDLIADLAQALEQI